MSGFSISGIVSERLVLGPVEERDAAEVYETWQDESFIRWAPVGYPYAGADLPTAIEWCTTGAAIRREDPGRVEFALRPRGADRMAGLVGLFDTDWDNGITEIHYWTAAWARGNGYAGEGARAVAEWALRQVGLERVVLRAAAGNAPSLRVAESAGFRAEGVLRSAAVLRAGGRTDHAVYSLIRADLRRGAGK
ncbi:GNAT family N-acetyltransferase [Catenuloplanes indicus]|uniref:RimJ/RimL family protein N-acetyltransferase n=1 Tax=Catenuloplanes indicus TaxID=137267 RepID=A0AAE3VUM3_9ACTN|nr:GNAT family protein [Catenuloplanes indicus]MDQ0364313.1 RimJ/RimL family protein N-acetyltransferase [Catenuloplanes indicus]